MKRIGLTGSIAAGKSTVAARLRELGAFVLDADEASKALSAKASPLLAQIEQSFGAQVITADGSLDRRLLSSIVFANEDARRKLEAIMHPAIKKRLLEMEKERGNANIIVYDVPLLFETGMHESMDEVWVVDAPKKTRIERLAARNGLRRTEAEQRLSAQMNDEEKRKRADVVIENDGTREELLRKVDSLWQKESGSF